MAKGKKIPGVEDSPRFALRRDEEGLYLVTLDALGSIDFFVAEIKEDGLHLILGGGHYTPEAIGEDETARVFVENEYELIWDE